MRELVADPLIPPAPPNSGVGVEWVVEAFDCPPLALTDPKLLTGLCEQLLADLRLHAVAPPLWHKFPDPGGVTGLYLLAESHLACHTYPEFGLATFNLYCCRPRQPWPWQERLSATLGAGRVLVRTLRRGRPGVASEGRP